MSQSPQPWEYSLELAACKPADLEKDIDDIETLELEYSIFLTQLVALYKDGWKNFDKEKKDLFVRVMKRNEQLEFIYQNYLNVPRKVTGLQLDQRIFRRVLSKMEYDISTDVRLTPSSKTSVQLRNITLYGNFPRNLLARLRRVLVALPPVLDDIHANQANHLIKHYDPTALFLFSHAAWVFFLPRLLTNVFFLIKHSVRYEGMNEKEQNLDTWFRIKTQLKRRAFELTNDTMWFSLGLLNAFVFTGALAPIGLMATVGVLAMDVILASIRWSVEVARLERLLTKYQMILMVRPDDKETLNLSSHIKQRLSYEKKQLSIQVISTSILLAAFCFSGLIFPVNPILAMTCLSIAVAVTLCNFIGTRLYEKLKPNDKLGATLKDIKSEDWVPPVATNGFFSRSSESSMSQSPSESHLNYSQ